MARPEKLTVAEALAQAQLIDSALAAWEATAPVFVASIGGRDALALRSEMTCVGPVPRLDSETWQGACLEYVERYQAEAEARRLTVLTGRVEADVEPTDRDEIAPEAPARSPKRAGWRVWRR